MDVFTRINDAHERLKDRVHTFWRQNRYLSPRGTVGKVFMSCVYFSIPVVIGYYVSTYAVALSESTVEERLGTSSSSTKKGILNNDNDNDNKNDDNNTNTVEFLGGDKIRVGDKIEKVGAGGWGGGVHLVTSDQQTQDVNRINLERFLKKQRKLRQKQEQQQQEQQQEQQEQNDGVV